MREDWIEIENIVEQRSEKVDPSERPDLSFVGMDCIEPHSIRPTFYYKFSNFKSLGNYYQEGDILYGRLRPYLNKVMIGKSEGSASGEFIVLSPSRHVYPKFLLYHLHSRDFVAFANKQVSGDRPRIKYDQIKKYALKYLPLPEQRAIVAKVEQLFSELDNGIANLKAAKDKLEIYRQAVLKKAFEGAFTIDWRRKQVFDTTWKNTVLSEVAKWGSGGTPSRKIDEYFTGDIPWVKTGELGAMYVDDAEEKITHEAILKSSAKVFPKGSVGIAMYGATIGKTSIFNAPLATNQACAVAQPNEDIDVVFLYYYLLSQKYDLIRKGQGGAQPNISQGILKEHPISVPRIEEQNQIVQEIETRLSVCDNILANIEEGLEKSEALRQSILKQAFEGKLLSEEELEVCRKEPDWEPAEQLLARIKAGKETSVKKEKAHAKQTPKKKIHHVEYYKRTLLAAEIVWQLHQQPTLGHLKLQKLIYLCQESGNMQLPTNFLQQAAGPYDPQMARSIDKQLKTKKWFTYRKNELLKYEPLEKAGGHQTDLKKYYTKDINNIQKVIGLFRTAKSDQIEIVATLYACWKKIIREKAVFSENLLIKRFYEWSEEKSKYPESRVKKAVEWMREKGIVPVNAGKQTIDE